MSQQPSLILPALLNKLLDDHVEKESVYYSELHRRTDAYKAQLEKCKQAIAERRSQRKRKVEIENEHQKKRIEPYRIAQRMTEKWIAQAPGDRNLDVPRESTLFQYAVQVLLVHHHLTIVDNPGDWDIDGDNPAEEQIQTWLMNGRLESLDGTTPLEAELKRLDTPVVVQSVLRELWTKYPYECGDIGLGRPSPDDRAEGGDDDDDQAYLELAEWAAAELKGKQRLVVEFLADNNGVMPLPDLKLACEWEGDEFGRCRQHVNKKLRKVGWIVERHDNEARLRQI